MNWDLTTIVGSASAASIILILLNILIKKLIERSIDNQFEVRIAKLRNELSKSLEAQKSELNVWADLRKEILLEMWRSHRDVIKAMTSFIMAIQEPLAFSSLNRQNEKTQVNELKPPLTIELSNKALEYRQNVHNSIEVLSNEGISLCERFSENTLKLCEIVKESEIAEDFVVLPEKKIYDIFMKLKEIRREFLGYIATSYGLEKMMPWMANDSTQKEK